MKYVTYKWFNYTCNYQFQDDVESLCINIVEKFGPILSKIDYVQTFRCLREKYDQYQEKIKDKEKGNLPMDR